MDTLDFVHRVRRTYSTQGLRLRFDKITGMIGLMRLESLCRQERAKVTIAKSDKIVVAAVLESHSWGGDHNRSVVFHGLMNVDSSRLSQIAQDVECLELCEKHGAQGLMFKRQKTFSEAVAKIITEILTPELVREIEGWDMGLTIIGESTTYLDLPALQFMICKEDGEMILRIILDGWTGHYGIDGGIGDDLYLEPKQLQDYILANLEKRLDEMTATIAA
jgi:hypothetical protein